MKSLTSAGFPQTLCSQTVLSMEGCSTDPFNVEAMFIVTTLFCSDPFSPLLCTGPSWYAGCCCATRGLCVCYVLPCPFIIWVIESGCLQRKHCGVMGGGVGSSYPPILLAWDGGGGVKQGARGMGVYSPPKTIQQMNCSIQS